MTGRVTTGDQMSKIFKQDITPDWQGLVDCIMRKGTPARVHYIELFIDGEVKDAVCERFNLLDNLDKSDPHYDNLKEIIIQRFLGYDYVRCSLDEFNMPLEKLIVEDTAGIKREEGRSYINEQVGPITTWEEFEKYPWPDPDKCRTTSLEWYEKNLPEDMCIIGSGGFAHFAEYLSWLMGYETLCYALFENVIEDVVTASNRYGHRIAHLGGIDVDFICRTDEKQIRDRVRNTLESCFEGGGYCLGTGNSVANYIPVENYLAMLDEGRDF